MTMELKQIILYLCVCTVACFPSKPLNDRPSELAWQAWLLVDSQNQGSESDRRITPKSVFIAPNIGNGNGNSNGSLPDCADGYRSDPMGRCIKYVKLDEAAHLDFLLQRLNAMYATRPSEDLDDEAKPTSGPLQVNIPLGGGGFPSKEEAELDPEIAVVVAPTNENFDMEEDKKDYEIDPDSELAIFVAPLNRNFDIEEEEEDKQETDNYPEISSTNRNFNTDEKRDEEESKTDVYPEMISTTKNFQTDKNKKDMETAPYPDILYINRNFKMKKENEETESGTNSDVDITSTYRNFNVDDKQKEISNFDRIFDIDEDKKVKFDTRTH